MNDFINNFDNLLADLRKEYKRSFNMNDAARMVTLLSVKDKISAYKNILLPLYKNNNKHVNIFWNELDNIRDSATNQMNILFDKKGV